MARVRSPGTRRLRTADIREFGAFGETSSSDADDNDSDEEASAGAESDGKETAKATSALPINERAFSGSGSVDAVKN